MNLHAAVLDPANQPGATQKTTVVSLWQDESGQDLIEYALIATFIGLALVTSMKKMSDGVVAVFQAVGNTLTSNV